MSLKFRNANGVETPVAGLNGTSGELVPSVSLYQSGSKLSDTDNWVPGDSGVFSITFSTPMPDADYDVILGIDTPEINVSVAYDKTVNGFKAKVENVSSVTYAGRIEIYWQAFKLMTNEDRALDEARIEQNTTNFASAFSEVASYAVGDYVTYGGVLYKCTTAHTAGVWVAGHFTQATVGGTLNDIVPSDASSSNKLVATNAIYKTLTRYWNDAGNRFIKLSNAYPTFGLKTNNYIVSCRNDETYLLVCGTTDGGDIVAPQVYLLYSGTGKLVTNGFYYDSTTKEIAFMTQGYNAVSVTQISGEVKDIILSELSETNPLSNPLVITPQKLVTESEIPLKYLYCDGSSYTSLEDLLAVIVASIGQIASNGSAGVFNGVWTGKSHFSVQWVCSAFASASNWNGWFSLTLENIYIDHSIYSISIINSAITTQRAIV